MDSATAGALDEQLAGIAWEHNRLALDMYGVTYLLSAGVRAIATPLACGNTVVFKGSGFYTTDYRSESYKKRAAEDGTQSQVAQRPGEGLGLLVAALVEEHARRTPGQPAAEVIGISVADEQQYSHFMICRV